MARTARVTSSIAADAAASDTAPHNHKRSGDRSDDGEGDQGQHLAEGSVFGGSIPTLLTGRFRLLPFLATLPLSLPVTRLFPSGNWGYRLVRPVEG